jgi:site-specific recombinase XerD
MAVLYSVTLERDSTGALLRAFLDVPLIDDYLRYLATIGRSPTTWSSYAYDLAVFCRWLADQEPTIGIETALRGLTPTQVFTFVEHELTPGEGRPGLAPTSVYRRVVALAKFFDWAHANGLVDRNPVPRERPHAASRQRGGGRPAFLRVPTPLPRPTPPDELAAFSATLRTWRDRALVALLAGAGLRLSEALGLRLRDLDWGGKQVFVRHGKGGHQRYAMVPDAAWKPLKAYLDAERPEPIAASSADEPVFVVLRGSARGQPLTAAGVQSLFRHHRTLAQTPNVAPHRLRHTCGTELHRAGLPLESLQEQLGHRRLDSTRRYVHLSNERLRLAYLAVEARLYQDTRPEEVS